MAEWKLFDGAVPHVSTFEFHEHRDRVAHLEQEGLHRERLIGAGAMVRTAVDALGGSATVSDLGCGDGGLLSVVQAMPGVSRAWGYDFQPSNAAGWAERSVSAQALDVYGADRGVVEVGDIAIATEVLEHLADPHGAVRWIAGKARYLVASSPFLETDLTHGAEHAWAWDREGYRDLIVSAGFDVVLHETITWSQLILARSREVGHA